ncbi:MAG: hypothetical protein OHK0017_02640 [Patescibacteria group bacterium]
MANIPIERFSLKNKFEEVGKLPGLDKLFKVNFEEVEESLGQDQAIKLALIICGIVPTSCPMETIITINQKKYTLIPKLCKLNPYHQGLAHIQEQAGSYLLSNTHKVTPEIITRLFNGEIDRIHYLFKIPEMLSLTIRLLLSDDINRTLQEELRFAELYSKITETRV